MSKVVLQLETISCPSCIKKIEDAVSKMSGVESVKVLFNSSKVRADFDETNTSADAIKETVQKLGYSVENIKVPS